MSSIKLSIIATHPIQYYVPLYREIFSRSGITGEVLYASNHGLSGKAFDPDFGDGFDWDINLTEGYPFRFLNIINRFGQPSSNAVRWLTDVSSSLTPKKYDVVLIPGYRPIFEMQAIIKCIRSQIPIMLRPEGYEKLNTSRSAKSILRSTYLSWIYSRVAAYLAVGSRSREHFLVHGGDPTKIVSSPYCVNNDFFQMGANEKNIQRDNLRKIMNIDRDAFVIVYVGKMIQRKPHSYWPKQCAVHCVETKYI